MFLKNLADVCLLDIDTLCEDKALESRFLDFKAEPIGSSDRDKREFLADVCAYANASGGDLILGVTTNEGAADGVVGIDIADPDKEKQRLVNLIRDGLEPRVSGFDTKWLPIKGPRGVMVVRTARSCSPNRVTFLKDMNFYIRNPAGKHPMSVDELRRSFNLTASVADKMGGFRNERVRKIALEWPREIPFSLRARGKSRAQGHQPDRD